MGIQEQSSGLGVGRDTLEQGESIAAAITDLCRELRWTEEWIDGDDLLEESCDRSVTVPEDESEIREILPTTAQLRQGILASFRIRELLHELIEFLDRDPGLLLLL